ncbi:MAG: hypothetical protein IIB80_07760 [Thaumarchaeota archaeon]|nr:hypothetical protein [Nitrososphaerota archaeon]
MNLYDTKVIRCVRCEKDLGEIDYDANVIRPMCGQCYDPTPDVRDQLSYRMKIPTNKKIEKTIPA